ALSGQLTCGEVAMRKHWQKALGAGVCLLLAVGTWLGLGVVHEWGMGFGELRRLQEQLDRLRRVEAAIDAERNHMRTWAELKTRSMEDLVAGRRTLRDVAREWRDRGAISSFCRQFFRDKYPGRSEDELVCRYVLWYAKGFLDEGL